MYNLDSVKGPQARTQKTAAGRQGHSQKKEKKNLWSKKFTKSLWFWSFKQYKQVFRLTSQLFFSLGTVFTLTVTGLPVPSLSSAHAGTHKLSLHVPPGEACISGICQEGNTSELVSGKGCI